MFSTIGIGIAFSPNLKANIFEAFRYASVFKGQLILIHVGDKTEEKRNKLLDFIKEVPNNDVSFKLVFSPGHPVEVILAKAEENNVDLLLIGALQRENIVKYYMGSIARKISRQAKCSILLMTHPSIEAGSYDHIVVNGLADPKTKKTISAAFYTASKLFSKRITIVEEITQDEIAVKVKDSKSLRRSTIARERLRVKEDLRVKKILEEIPTELKAGVKIKIQAIFGKRGYSIGHYAEVVRADLLIMNAPSRLRVWDRIFPHDIEYILTELPSDTLIIR